MKLLKNDKVQVISGDQAGTVSRVLAVIPEKSRVIVERVNLVKRHRKARSQQVQAGIVEKEAAIHISNVALYCERCAKGVRVKVEGRGKERARTCASCGSQISKG